MNENVDITKEAQMKSDFVKYVAMLIRKYGNLDKKNIEKEAA